MKSVRILCTASIGYCTAVFLSHYLLFGESVIAVLALPVMLALSAFLFRGRMRTRLIIAALAMALGFGQYWRIMVLRLPNARCSPERKLIRLPE